MELTNLQIFPVVVPRYLMDGFEMTSLYKEAIECE